MNRRRGSINNEHSSHDQRPLQPLEAVIEEARGKVKAFQQQAISSSEDPDGRRPVFGGAGKFQNDIHWRDYLLFYEYFHGDNGAGLGASHQTGWTGMIARIIHLFATLTPEHSLEAGKLSYFERAVRSRPAASVVGRP